MIEKAFLKLSFKDQLIKNKNSWRVKIIWKMDFWKSMFESKNKELRRWGMWALRKEHGRVAMHE